MASDRPVNHSRELLKSLNCDGWQGAALLLCCVLLLAPLAGGEALQHSWRYEREALAHGQLWRLVTAHLVHLNVEHALLNVIGLVLLWVLFAGLQGWRETLWVALAAMAAIDAGFWFLTPGLAWYVGASGVLHGIMAAGIVRLLREADRMALLAAALLAAKLAWEQTHGALPFETQAPVVVNAHLFGTAGGLVAAALSWARGMAIMRAHQGRGEHV